MFLPWSLPLQHFPVSTQKTSHNISMPRIWSSSITSLSPECASVGLSDFNVVCHAPACQCPPSHPRVRNQGKMEFKTASEMGIPSPRLSLVLTKSSYSWLVEEVPQQVSHFHLPFGQNLHQENSCTTRTRTHAHIHLLSLNFKKCILTCEIKRERKHWRTAKSSHVARDKSKKHEPSSHI